MLKEALFKKKKKRKNCFCLLVPPVLQIEIVLNDEDIVAVLTKKVTSASEDQRGYMSKILNWKLSIYWLGECHVVACF